MTADPLAEKLEELRRAFDESFTRPAAGDDEEVEHLLAVRVGSQAYAVRLAEVRGLHPAKRIIAAPTREPAFLGLAGLRGTVVPVFGLAALLGHEAGRAPAWIILPAGREDVALAFEGYEGHWTVPRPQLLAARCDATDEVPVVRFAADSRPLLDVAAAVATLRRRVATAAIPEERET